MRHHPPLQGGRSYSASPPLEIDRLTRGDSANQGGGVKTWIENAVLIEESYQHPTAALHFNEGKAAEILGPLYTPPEADK